MSPVKSEHGPPITETSDEDSKRDPRRTEKRKYSDLRSTYRRGGGGGAGGGGGYGYPQQPEYYNERYEERYHERYYSFNLICLLVAHSRVKLYKLKPTFSNLPVPFILVTSPQVSLFERASTPK